MYKKRYFSKSSGIQSFTGIYLFISAVLEKLGTEEYNIDHIYPQAFVKDDSIINNKGEINLVK